MLVGEELKKEPRRFFGSAVLHGDIPKRLEHKLVARNAGLRSQTRESCTESGKEFCAEMRIKQLLVTKFTVLAYMMFSTKKFRS